MYNSDFRLLVESLGFYSVKSVVKYLNNFDSYNSLTERPVDYWLKGKKNISSEVPLEVQEIFLNLKRKQTHIVQRELSYISIKNFSFKYVYKNEELMWEDHPELFGLPVTFLNQIIIRLNLSLDYYENNKF